MKAQELINMLNDELKHKPFADVVVELPMTWIPRDGILQVDSVEVNSHQIIIMAKSHDNPEPEMDFGIGGPNE